jgi:hypothetical protein
MSEEAKEPRELADIQKEYQEVCAITGQLHYQLEIIQKDLRLSTERLFALNIEASKRAELDKSAKNEEGKA